MFGAVFLLVAVAMHAYLYRRLVSDLTRRRAVRLTAVSGFGALGVVSMVGFARMRLAEPGVFSAVLPVWFGLVIYVVLALLIADLGRWLFTARTPKNVSEERRDFLAKAVAVSGVVAGSSLASFGAFRAFAPAQITEVPLKLARLPKALDGFSIVQLSDVHIGPVLQRRFLDDLVDRANSAKGDLVAITGDLVDNVPQHIGHSVEALTRLKAKYGTYFVTGNHDYYSGADAWVQVLQGWGVNVLRNRRVEIGDAGASFDLLGVDDFGGRGLVHDYDLDKAMAGRDPARASVLLAHQPAGFDTVAERGLDLQLSGHTHGGQTFPATGVASLMWGERAHGLSQTRGSHLYVSRGCGFVGPTTRLGAPPEIVKIVLLSA
ncbi:MAG: metallophosphoesterase [Archangiaceae bacterium]|nr:metallophosphoesterase [Archangiaceae bacterium]